MSRTKLKNRSSLNSYSIWKYLMIGLIILIAFFYALPNMYGDIAALQISPKNNTEITKVSIDEIKKTLTDNDVIISNIKSSKYNLNIEFSDTVEQTKAKTLLEEYYSESMTTALTLIPNTPNWLRVIGANPMNLGLDLRGGMYFVLEADLNTALKNQLDSYVSEIRSDLQEKKIRYNNISIKNNVLVIRFDSDKKNVLDSAKELLKDKYPNLTIKNDDNINSTLTVKLSEIYSEEIKKNAVSQVVQVMRNRVNELGVAEASVSKAGNDRVIIELPGIQDAARAKQILGGTATVNFNLVNMDDDIAGHIPLGSSLLDAKDDSKIMIYNKIILGGDAIVGATVGTDNESGLPIVKVRLSGPQVSNFSKVTGENIGKLMATVLVQTTYNTEIGKNGKKISIPHTSKKVISYANIQSRLGNNFQISGFSIMEAKNLALMIRSGSLPTPVHIVQEQQIGPSLGAENIEMGKLSILISLGLVLAFMIAYYRGCGIIANIALISNLLLIVAIMSIMPGATLTLPGIAGIVLNLGMSIDGNVLIFERIREELRNGLSVQAAIHAGYERAWGTIVDSHLTTLIVAVILFAIGSGAVKGFAVTLIIGIITSMFTSVFVSRAITNLWYGKRQLKKLSIGI